MQQLTNDLLILYVFVRKSAKRSLQTCHKLKKEKNVTIAILTKFKNKKTKIKTLH